jgi:hypothetical protein
MLSYREVWDIETARIGDVRILCRKLERNGLFGGSGRRWRTLRYNEEAG